MDTFNSTMPDIDREDELPSLKDLLTLDFTQSLSVEISDSENGQKAAGQESAQKSSDLVFDVFTEDDDNGPSQQDGQSGESTTRVFPSPDRLLESPKQPTQTIAALERETEDRDANGGSIQEVIGLRQTTIGLECQVIIYTTRWLSRTAVETKLLRRFQKRQRVRKAFPKRRSLRLKMLA
jgi:hypothetical protein